MIEVATAIGSGVKDRVEALSENQAIRFATTETPLAKAKVGSIRFATLDAVRGLAACLIVAHHLTYYGRASELALGLAPVTINFFYEHARMVVQLFLVLGGFALAWSTADKSYDRHGAVSDFVKRYVRLFVPYAAMLAFLLVLAGDFSDHRFDTPIVDSISYIQVLAHLFFLQDLLGFQNLSAGTWYLCIDIQFVGFYLLINAIVWECGRRFGWKEKKVLDLFATILALFGLVAVWYWNRSSGNDFNVFYFLGPLVLGSLIGLDRKKKISGWILPTFCLLMALSFWFDPRSRLLVALASGLFVWLNVHFLAKIKVPSPFLWLGKISYSLFLIHYSVNWLLMIALDDWMGEVPIRGLVALGICFVGSLIAGTILHYGVEQPTLRWFKPRTDSKKAHELTADRSFDAAFMER